MPRPVTEPKGFIPAPGVVQVEMQYKHLGQFCENVYHLKNTGAAPADPAAKATDIGNAMIAWETAHGKFGRCSATSFTGVVVRYLEAQDAPVFEFAPSAPVAGLGGGNPQPGNVTFAVKWLTLRRGRSFRGRTYQIGIPLSTFTGQALNDADRQSYITHYQHLVTDIVAATGFTLAVLSYSNNKMWRDSAVATPVTQCAIDPNLDSQRRRLNGHGN